MSIVQNEQFLNSWKESLEEDFARYKYNRDMAGLKAVRQDYVLAGFCNNESGICTHEICWCLK